MAVTENGVPIITRIRLEDHISAETVRADHGDILIPMACDHSCIVYKIPHDVLLEAINYKGENESGENINDL